MRTFKILLLILLSSVWSVGATAAVDEPELERPTLTGKLVTLRVGKGFDVADADGIALALERFHGCPATVEQGGAIRDGFFPKNVTVYVDGKKIIRTKDVGSAMAQAVTECKVDAQ